MSLAASFLPRIAFALPASRVAPLAPLTHAAAQADLFERLPGQNLCFWKGAIYTKFYTLSYKTLLYSITITAA
jgi:hypothetical protein